VPGKSCGTNLPLLGGNNEKRITLAGIDGVEGPRHANIAVVIANATKREPAAIHTQPGRAAFAVIAADGSSRMSCTSKRTAPASRNLRRESFCRQRCNSLRI